MLYDELLTLDLFEENTVGNFLCVFCDGCSKQNFNIYRYNVLSVIVDRETYTGVLFPIRV